MDTKIIISAVALGITMINSSAATAPKAQPEPKAEFKVMDAKFMTIEERAKWIAEMRTSLPMARRALGPFGYSQTPGAIVKKVKTAPKRSDEFSKAIQAFKITAVMPGDDKFVIGAREFKEGEVLPVVFQGKQLRINIVSVQLDYILFKDMNTGEQKKLNMTEMPAGLSRDNKITSVPGVTPAGGGKTEPLVLSQ